MLLAGTAKPQIESLSKWMNEWPAGKQSLVLLTGPTASGKTALWKQVTDALGKLVVEFTGFSEKLPVRLGQLKQATTAKTVADFAGMSYGKKPDVLVIEDANMSSAQGQKAVLAFARYKVMPVICVTSELPEKVLLDAALHIRMQRPPLDLVAKELLRHADELGLADFALRDAKGLAESCNCDIRQAKIEVQLLSYGGGSGSLSFGDRSQPNSMDATSHVFASRNICEAETSDHMVPLIVAENYHKAKGMSIERACLVVDSISRGDSLRQVEDSMTVFSQVKVPCVYAADSLSTRPSYPTVVAHCAALATNKRRLPCPYDLLQPIENRIIKTLSWAPASAVANEMRSLGLTKMVDWEAVRTLAPIGRQPVHVTLEKKDELSRCLTCANSIK